MIAAMPQTVLLGFSWGVTLMLVAALVGGVVFAIIQRPMLGASASTFAALGFGVLAFVKLAGLIWNQMAPGVLVDHLGVSKVMLAFGIYGIATQILTGVGLALLMAAVFVRRPQPAVYSK